MKLLFLSLYLYLFPIINSNKIKPNQIIKNVNLPSCKNCKFFSPSLNSYFDSPFNNCEKFGEKNIFSNDIIYDSAFSCRKDEYKCGEYGKFFEKEPNLAFKKFKHFAGSSLPNALVIVLLCLSLISIALKK